MATHSLHSTLFSCAAPTVCVQVGVFANVRGEFSVVEYSDISEVLARRITTTGQLMLSASHVCINYYTRDFLEAGFRFVAAIFFSLIHRFHSISFTRAQYCMLAPFLCANVGCTRESLVRPSDSSVLIDVWIPCDHTLA
jgi:hypothetical protein